MTRSISCLPLAPTSSGSSAPLQCLLYLLKDDVTWKESLCSERPLLISAKHQSVKETSGALTTGKRMHSLLAACRALTVSAEMSDAGEAVERQTRASVAPRLNGKP